MNREYFICTLLNTMRNKGYISEEKYIFLKSQLCNKKVCTLEIKKINL